jgi:membrane associated rhomboid family serine protease
MTAPDPSDEPRGLVLDERVGPPGISVVAVAAALGSVWGLLGYSILWEGEPVQVQRPFVESVAGTVALLPVRVVLWAIHLAEDLAGRTFELAENHWWIGVAAAIVGAAILAVSAFVVRTVIRRLRRDDVDARMSA